jgi:hypothetical protein
MTEPLPSAEPLAGASREATLAALFAAMVMQQTNMALIFLGKTPHPETGQPVRDFDAARMFIDQLEMLEAKTKGNLTPDEARLLKQSLMTVRMAFVDAVEHPSEPTPAAAASPASSPQAQTSAAGVEPSASAQTDESKRKFVKKY